MASVAETLNNAIYSLASLNPTQHTAVRLNENWQRWFAEAPRAVVVPTPMYLAQLKTFWLAYAGARALASSLNERTPAPDTIDPTVWKTITEAADHDAELVSDAFAAVRSSVATSKKTLLLIASIAAVAVIFASMRR